MSEPLTFAELTARCLQAGLPSPVMTKTGVAIIAVQVSPDNVVPSGRLIEPPRKASVTTDDYRIWAEAAGGWQAAADWLNDKLGTRYTRSDTRRWAHPEEPSHRPIPAKVVQLLTDTKRRG